MGRRRARTKENILKLRKEGLKWTEIAMVLEISRQRVWQIRNDTR